MFDPGAIAYRAMEARAPGDVGHAGDPPPVPLKDEGVVKTTRWYGERVPTLAVTVFELSRLTAVPEAAVVTMKEFAAGARAYSTVEVKAAVFAGQVAGVTPEPVTAVGAGAVKVRTCPANKVPTAADTTLFVIPVTGAAAGKVETMKVPPCGYAAYRAALAIAAVLAGHATVPPPLSVRVAPLCGVNRSSAPGASVPTDADMALLATLEMVAPDTPTPTTQ